MRSRCRPPTVLYLGGGFTKVSGHARPRLAQLNPSTGEVAPFRPEPDASVLVLRATSDRLYAGGEFTAIDGRAQTRLAAIDRDSRAVVASFAPRLDRGAVRAIALGVPGLYVGGGFDNAGDEPHAGIALVRPSDGRVVSDFNPGSGLAAMRYVLWQRAGTSWNRCASAVGSTASVPRSGPDSQRSRPGAWFRSSTRRETR